MSLSWNWVAAVEKFQRQKAPIAIVTVTHCTGSTPRELGAKMVVLSDGRFEGTIGGGRLESMVIADAKKCIEQNQAQSIRYPLGAKTGQCCGGVVEVFIETMNAGPVLYLFGAGHVGQAVCRTLVGTPFQIHVIDERPEWIQSEQIPSQVFRHESAWQDFVSDAAFSPEKTYVAIMTHRHDVDQEIVEYFLRNQRAAVRYIGMIGSQSKWARFQQRLTQRGIEEAILDRVKCPIGLKTGGKAPQEVAISVAAELLKNHYAC